MAKPIEKDKWAVESEPETNQLLGDCSWSQSRHFYLVDPKPEIWVPFIQPRFVG